MPASRSVYRTPNTDIHMGDPQLTLEWSEHAMSVSNNDGTMPFDSQSEVGLISPKSRNILSGCCNSLRINSNWRIFAVVTVIFVLFVSGFITGYLTRRFVHKRYMAASLTPLTTDVEEYDDSDTKIDYYYNYTEAVRKIMFDNINVDLMEKDLKALAKTGHHAGSDEVKNVADYIFNELQKATPEMKVERHTSKTLLSLPKCAEGKDNRITESGPQDPLEFIWSGKYGRDGDDAYLAYAPTQAAEGPLVFGAYGRVKDFESLRKAGVNLTGTIALIRFGRIPRYAKVQNAMNAGVAGVVIYAESPNTPTDSWVGRASDKAMSGTILSPDGLPFATAKIFPPNVTNYVANLQNRTFLPNIPAISISEAKAAELIKVLNGDDSANPLVGADDNLPNSMAGKVMKYGPTKKSYRVESCSSIEYGEVTNIVGILPGFIEKDRFVIVASHHDSWGPGGIDPHSGSAVMLGLARAAAKDPTMRPRRSIMFVSFDAEEMGMLGSSEFVKRLETQFGAGSAVGAICLDGVLRGQFIPYIRADPMMKNIFLASARPVPAINQDITVSSLYDQWAQRSEKGTPYVYQLDTSSDHSMLSFFAGIPTAAVQYWYDYNARNKMTYYPAYHTALDNYTYAANVDPEWKALTAVTRLTADAMLTLADSVLLPLNCTPVADYIKSSLVQLKSQTTGKDWVQRSLLSTESLDTKASKFANICSKLLATDVDLIQINDSPSKLRNRSWHYAGVRERNDALVVALQAFVQQPLSYYSQYMGGQVSQSVSQSGRDRRPSRQPLAHSSAHMRHVLFPPSISMKPDRVPEFFALSAAVDAVNSAPSLTDDRFFSAVNREFQRLSDGIEQATAILERSIDLRQRK